MENSCSRKLLRIGITHGDVNGIGYEVIMKALSDARLAEFFTPVVYGSSKVASYHKKALDISEFNFHIVKSAEFSQPGKANMINICSQEIKIDLGQSTSIAGEMAYVALETATSDLKKGLINALVTAPINKQNIQSRDFSFPGHTEYLTRKFGAEESLMLMVGSGLRIGVLTGHVSLASVPGLITRELVMRKVRLMNQSLLRDFGIRRPRIALLGVNPHAGDHGVLGTEEQDTLVPAIRQLFDEGILVFGPYPADGFFGTAMYNKFDGVLAMYHDQGLIPFKAMAFMGGVNFTAGLPVVRTSPAHGTAYDLAGKNVASPESLREAIFLAIDIVKNRALHKEITANPLTTSALDVDTDSDRNVLKDLPENNE
ncbi:MAG TPA: 4-hydroxythreonine-4-phosphate dehydrogenase PdxA [Bacteroidales bacterium]|nr:4-hydroxythreonine-4-phosphate dehydrogenase PdxA [Bacteroidales bacterium]